MSEAPVRYQSYDEDSARWDGFAYRADDIVVSSRSKTGTTWLQMICALLVFQSPRLPQPLSELSPWLDRLTEPREQLFARLAAQQHRRVIKTHTPLDGIALDSRATYLVPARHPLDAAVSLYHQADNLDRQRIRQLMGEPPLQEVPRPRPTAREWLLVWIDDDADPRRQLDSLPGVMWHLRDAWSRRADAKMGSGREDANVVLIHYDDLSSDLGGQMRALATRLGIDVAESVWPELIEAATFEQMRAHPAQVAPDRGVLKSSSAFFRRGSSGAGRELLTDIELADYHAKVKKLAPADLLEWLHRGEQ